MFSTPSCKTLDLTFMASMKLILKKVSNAKLGKLLWDMEHAGFPKCIGLDTILIWNGQNWSIVMYWEWDAKLLSRKAYCQCCTYWSSGSDGTKWRRRRRLAWTSRGRGRSMVAWKSFMPLLITSWRLGWNVIKSKQGRLIYVSCVIIMKQSSFSHCCIFKNTHVWNDYVHEFAQISPSLLSYCVCVCVV